MEFYFVSASPTYPRPLCEVDLNAAVFNGQNNFLVLLGLKWKGIPAYYFSGNFPPYPLLLEPPRLLIFKKISSLPVFFTYTNEKISTLPAVIKAYPVIKFEEKLQPTLLLEPPLVLET